MREMPAASNAPSLCQNLKAWAHLNTAICALWATVPLLDPLLCCPSPSTYAFPDPPPHTHTSLFLSLRFSSFMSPVMNVSHWWHLSGGHTQISDARSHILHARPHSQCHLASAGSDKCFSVQVSFFINIPHKPDLQYPWAIWHITEKIDRSREERKGMECNPGRSHFLFRTPGVSVSSISDVIFP